MFLLAIESSVFLTLRLYSSREKFFIYLYLILNFFYKKSVIISYAKYSSNCYRRSADTFNDRSRCSFSCCIFCFLFQSTLRIKNSSKTTQLIIYSSRPQSIPHLCLITGNYWFSCCSLYLLNYIK